jgi:hypothetical protein
VGKSDWELTGPTGEKFEHMGDSSIQVTMDIHARQCGNANARHRRRRTPRFSVNFERLVHEYFGGFGDVYPKSQSMSPASADRKNQQRFFEVHSPTRQPSASDQRHYANFPGFSNEILLQF